MKCPKCKAPMEKGQKFCARCGCPASKHSSGKNALLIILSVLILAIFVFIGIKVIFYLKSSVSDTSGKVFAPSQADTSENSADRVVSSLLEFGSESSSESGSQSESSAEESSAVMLSGWIEEDGGWRYYEGGTYLTREWVQDEGYYYYLDTNGYMTRNSWVQDGGSKYYVDQDGHMMTEDWLDQAGNSYYFDQNGRMVTKTWVDTDAGRRYLGADGKMVQDGWAYQDLVEDGPAQPCYVSPFIRNGVLLTSDWVVLNPTETFQGAECAYFNENGDFSCIANMDYIEDMLDQYYRSYLISINEQDIGNLEYTSDINRSRMASRISNSSNRKNLYTAYGIWIDWDSVDLADNGVIYINALVQFDIVNRSDGLNEHTSSNYYSFELRTDHYEDDYIVYKIAYPSEAEYEAHQIAAFE